MDWGAKFFNWRFNENGKLINTSAKIRTWNPQACLTFFSCLPSLSSFLFHFQEELSAQLEEKAAEELAAVENLQAAQVRLKACAMVLSRDRLNKRNILSYVLGFMPVYFQRKPKPRPSLFLSLKKKSTFHDSIANLGKIRMPVLTCPRNYVRALTSLCSCVSQREIETMREDVEKAAAVLSPSSEVRDLWTRRVQGQQEAHWRRGHVSVRTHSPSVKLLHAHFWAVLPCDALYLSLSIWHIITLTYAVHFSVSLTYTRLSCNCCYAISHFLCVTVLNCLVRRPVRPDGHHSRQTHGSNDARSARHAAVR